MDTAAFDYVLPPALIAQQAVEPRDAAKLLVTIGDTHEHRHVRELDQFLQPDDLLILNRTRVIPARLFGKKSTGGEVEVLLVHREPTDTTAGERWRSFVRGKVRPGSSIVLDDITAEVTACDDASGDRLLNFPIGCNVLELADRIGHIPLPPYIQRADTPADRERYQTVFGDRPGSVAAPTASLHLTPELLARLDARGVHRATVTLAIGPGTFKPVQTERVEDHQIHAEYAECPAETVAAIAACRERGGRIIAVGTTVVRTIETAARQPGGLAPYTGWTRLFLHPPQRPLVIDGLLTNFHLPRSSLLMLVACFTGLERLHALYQAAIAAEYRFYSYGDAMLFLPGAADHRR